MPNPVWTRPTDAELAAVIERCRFFIDQRRDPIVALAVEEHRILMALHIVDPFAAKIVLRQLRDYATSEMENVEQRWSIRDADQRIKFTEFVEFARNWHAEVAQARQDANVISLAEQRGRHGPRPQPTTALAPAVLVTMPSPRLRAIGLLRQKREGRIWYDEFHKRIFSDWDGTYSGTVIARRGMTEKFILSVAMWLCELDDKLANISERQVKAWIETMAHMDTRNEPRDWLNTLTWDGTERLASVMPAGFGAPDSEFNRTVGRMWLIAMVARIMQPGAKADCMPVFIGPQGAHKSQALQIIGGAWYRAASSSIDQNKDFLQEIFGCMLFEIPELHSLVSSRRGEAKIKAVLSTEVDHFRVSYGTVAEDHARTCIFSGTTNNREWHSDETGARRLWPIHCGEIDLNWLRDNRDQLFAEARARFDMATLDEPDNDQGDYRPKLSRWYFLRGELGDTEQRELMARETHIDPWHAPIEARLARPDIYHGHHSETPTGWNLSATNDDPARWGNIVTTQRIATWLDMTIETLGRGANSRKIASIMHALGWESRQKHVPDMDSRPWVWLAPDWQPDGAPTAAPIVEEDEDIPF